MRFFETFFSPSVVDTIPGGLFSVIIVTNFDLFKKMYLLYYFLKLFYLELNAEFRKFIRNETSDLHIFMTYGTAILLKL